MQAHFLSLHTPTPRWTQKVKTFLGESSHVAYQITGNGTQSTMQAHFLPLHTLKVKTF